MPKEYNYHATKENRNPLYFTKHLHQNLLEPHRTSPSILSAKIIPEPHTVPAPEPPEPHKVSAPEPSGNSPRTFTYTFQNLIRRLHRKLPELHYRYLHQNLLELRT